MNNISSLVQIMTWRRSGGKPLYEPMVVSLLTHICVAQPQAVIIILQIRYIYIFSFNSSKLVLIVKILNVFWSFKIVYNYFRYFHANFGFNLRLWDWLYGTLRRDDRIYGENIFGGKGRPKKAWVVWQIFQRWEYRDTFAGSFRPLWILACDLRKRIRNYQCLVKDISENACLISQSTLCLVPMISAAL